MRRRREVIKWKLYSLGRNMIINIPDTKKEIDTKNGYLPGRNFSATWRNLLSLVERVENVDWCERYSSMILKSNNRSFELIAFYRAIKSLIIGVIKVNT